MTRNDPAPLRGAPARPSPRGRLNPTRHSINGALTGAIVIAAAFATAAGAEEAERSNWPSWRGSEGDGSAAAAPLPLEWSRTRNVGWKAPLPDRGNSTPAVWGDRVFVTQPLSAEDRRMLLCLDRGTGKELWRRGTVYEADDPTHRTNPYCSPSPATDGERVVAAFGSAGVFCYDLEGRELWHRDLGRIKHEWGYASSPVLHRDLCFVYHGPGKGSRLVALNKRSGETVWTRPDDPYVPGPRSDGFRGQRNGVVGTWSTPLVIEVDGREELVMSYPDWIVGIDPATGQDLWRCGGLNPLVYSSPLYAGGLVIALGGFNGPSVAVRPGGRGDVTGTHRAWVENDAPVRLGTGVVRDGHLFLVNMRGIAECIEIATGKRVWRERLKGTGKGAEVWSSPVLSGDRVYLMDQAGETFVFRASTTFEQLAANPLGEYSNSSVVAAGGELFLRTHKHLWKVVKGPSEGGIESESSESESESSESESESEGEM